MGAPGSGMQAAEETSAEALLSAFKTIDPAERRKHASVLNYWLSIRGDREFPPLHDLDPLEISDAGPNSVLLELISGGHDAEVRHVGEALRDEGRPERIIDAATPSVLSSIAKKLPIVAISRDFLAFEEEFATEKGSTRCWVTLLPLSAGGAWVDYVYGLVTTEAVPAAAAETCESPASAAEEPDRAVEEAELGEVAEAADELEAETAPDAEQPQALSEAPDEPEELAVDSGEEQAKGRPGFSKLLDNLAGLTGFYGHGYKVEGDMTSTAAIEQPQVEETVDQALIDDPMAAEPVAAESATDDLLAQAPLAPDEPPAAEDSADQQRADPPTPALEGPLQTKLADVRAKADEARQAKLRANAALYEGLSAAYDFALDAEDAPEEYLRLVESEGLKIQLRSPMRPVVKLAFNGMCDDATIRQLEAVLAWALDNELPRGSLSERIEAAGGIGPILQGEADAASAES